MGQQFTVFTNQKSLKFLLDQRAADEGQQKWLSKLLGYNFEVKYKAGSENRVADALSRTFCFSSLSFPWLLNGRIWKLKFWLTDG